MHNILPTTSKEAYKKAYEKFQAWRQEVNLRGPTVEKEVFAYLHQKLESDKWSSSGTLWCQFSMLKTMILSEEGLDMKNSGINTTIQTWLKHPSTRHKLKQAHMFTKEEVKHFIEHAPDSLIHLKLILLVGVYSGLRCDTIAQLEWRHLRLDGQQVEIFVDYETKTDQGATGTSFSFPRRADNPALDPLLLFNKYRSKIAQKDDGLLNGRLWLRIIQGKQSTDK
jgi:integrase